MQQSGEMCVIYFAFVNQNLKIYIYLPFIERKKSIKVDIRVWFEKIRDLIFRPNCPALPKKN